MRLLVHVEDMAEIFARVLLAEAPRHRLYNSGGIPVSLGELADIVRGFLPDAQITFASEGGREDSGNYLVDNTPPGQGVRDRVPGPAHARARGHQRRAASGRASAGHRAIGEALTRGGASCATTGSRRTVIST